MVKSKVNELQSLLAGSLGAEVQVLDQKTTLLTAPGEHYGSIMLALELIVQTSKEPQSKVLHLVAKLIPANEMLRLAFDIGVTFNKEVLAYTVAVPALVQLQKQYKVQEDKLINNLFPKCYGARTSLAQPGQVDEDGVLIFENLKLEGYKTEDRLKGFDFETSQLIVRDLARFHAVPLALKLLKPEEFRKKIMPCLIKNKGLEQLPEEVGRSFHEAIMKSVQALPELAEYSDKIQQIVDFAAENPFVNRPPPNELFGTMSHSDYWVSNTMILRDHSGKPISNKIVDLQIMTYSSAVRDLIFFLFTSVVNADLDVYFDDLLKTYHDSFLNVLEDFGLDLTPYNFGAFKAELEEVVPSELYHILVMLKPICTERGKVQNSLEDFEDSDWSREDLLGPNHRRKMRDTILSLTKQNWI